MEYTVSKYWCPLCRQYNCGQVPGPDLFIDIEQWMQGKPVVPKDY
jgi:hypothetical protein